MSNLRQSFSWWCVSNCGIEPDVLLATAAKIGYQGVDLIGEELWPNVKQAGLRISSVDGHANISDGLNHEKHAARIEQELLVKIEKARKWQIPTLICFSGDRHGASDEAGLEQCAKTLKKVAPKAAEAGVTLIMELLNSKVDHKGYQCDHTAWGVELCKRVDSPAFKLLYDIYHMQIMEGDIIRTIQENQSYIAHYHTAGNPGRNEPDDTQEIYYPAIYRAIEKTGYNGFIAHEFCPKDQIDPMAAFAKAFAACAKA